MNTDIIKTKWEQIKGDIAHRWGRLSDSHMKEINGDRAKLLSLIIESYGISPDEAEKQLAEFEKKVASKAPAE